MSQHRSIYKTDFVPHDWMENNFTPSSEFCSSENIDECVQYISKEFCALGYPSIYLNSDSCPYAVNCDIVKLLNVTFKLLGCNRDYEYVKDDLECRNRLLSAEIVSLGKKYSQLKEDSELLERKYRTALERERQLKEKNESLATSIRLEKRETKKLSSQIQQQKIAYQHEIHKYDNNIKALKSRLMKSTDKKSEKKVACVTSPNLLQRNSNERGKWVTGKVAESNLVEMYKSLISSYENHCQDMLKEIADYQQCFEYLQLEMLDVISFLKGEEHKKTISANAVPLVVIWSSPNKQKELQERFQSLMFEIKDSVSESIESKLEKIEDLNEKESKVRLSLNETCSIKEDSKKSHSFKKDSESPKDMLERQKKELLKKEKELAATSKTIEGEKKFLENQRLEIMRLAVKEEFVRFNSKQKHMSNHLTYLEHFEPSYCMVTTKSGPLSVPSIEQFKQCRSAPSEEVETLTPLWNMTSSDSNKKVNSTSENKLLPFSDCTKLEPCTSKQASEESDLPKWATACADFCTKEERSQFELLDTTSNEDLNTSEMTEEQSLSCLQAAFRDIERRRNQSSN